MILCSGDLTKTLKSTKLYRFFLKIRVFNTNNSPIQFLTIYPLIIWLSSKQSGLTPENIEVFE